MAADRVRVSLRPREAPLRVEGVAASGSAAVRLAQRLLGGPDERLARCLGAAAGDVLVLLGAEEDLPWVDGVRYLGRDPRAATLLLPTTLEPNVHPALLERALRATGTAIAPPFAVVPRTVALDGPVAIVGVAAARPVQSERLRAWVEATRGQTPGASP